LPRPNRYRGRVPLPSLGRLSTRSNLKPVNPGRHRNAAAKEAAEPAVEDHELTSYLAALAPDSDKESTGTGKRFGEAQVFQLRVNVIASEQLKDIAAERGTSPHALAQEWILERLSWEGQASSAQQRRHEEAHTEELHLDLR
jgi:aryl-alcohol dehydrogenase-like predicted oxidoreductase